MRREPASDSKASRHTRQEVIGHESVVGGTATFGRMLRARRRQLGFSLAQLAAQVHFDKGHVSKVETDKRTPSISFAEACDRVLDAGDTFTSIAEALEAAGRQQGWIHPAQLPAARRNFVGRGRFLHGLDSVLRADERSPGLPVAVIEGPPGVGKTALAVQWAQRAVHNGRFADGQLFVDLRGPGPATAADPFDVLAGVLAALGVPPELVPSDLDQRAATLRSFLYGRKVLLVMDNAADAGQIHPLLPGSRGCAVVITSRVRLPGLTSRMGAVTLTLPELAAAEATRLIQSIIGTVRTDADPDAVALLAERCGYLPLALVRAAEHIVNHRQHSAAALAADLKPEPARLGLAEGDVTLHRVFDSSYDLLDKDTARLFRTLGFLPGPGFSAADAAAIAGLGEDEAARLLRELAGTHLIRHRDERQYQFPDLLRIYATELARQLDTEADLALTMRRLADRYAP